LNFIVLIVFHQFLLPRPKESFPRLWCHLPYGIIQCYLPPDTSELVPHNPCKTGWGYASINLPRTDGRLSWPKLATYRGSLPVVRQSPIQVVTVSSVEQLRWSRPTCYTTPRSHNGTLQRRM